ncbi:hypothetical protein MKY66_03395 [Paenibacillus sp. FSL R5-0766]|uniref:hypothetical protein n=1 Tax=unclassified Paenibacillus TaxID=185978 RepID=UPI00096CA72E|nr:hypothetical protein [Paenibacillus sp. FSL R5-0765]OMF59423.1 hypothetical protein BK141_25260 [Paenibacillus sp. FSL R5-0765]
MELIPSADDKDINRVVELLTVDYHQWLASMKVLGKVTVLTPDQHAKYTAYKIQVDVVNAAIDAILDKEARDIITHQYIKSTRRKHTVALFQGRGMSERTVDRRINKGLLSISNTLKDCGMLWPSEK